VKLVQIDEMVSENENEGIITDTVVKKNRIISIKF